VKTKKTLKFTLLALLLLTATAALASGVKLVTFSGGSGQAGGAARGTTVTVGQGIAGKANHVAGNNMGTLGIWTILSQTHVVSPVGDETPGVRTHLFRNYPNPFNPSTRISFSLEKESQVKIEVYDLKGRKVDTLFQGSKPAGAHSIVYQPRNLASGAYVILMRAGDFRATQRMMLIK
jgi:hypothetical protein